MNFFSCLLIGKELASKIFLSSLKWGCCNGFVHNDVIGIITADLGDEKPSFCEASFLIAEHRFCKEFKKNVLVWLKENADELLALCHNSILLTEEQIQSVIPTELFEQINGKEKSYLLTMSKKDDYKLFAIKKYQDKFAFFLGEIELIDDELNPFDRMDGIVPFKKLTDKSVAIVGLGSGGGPISLELAAAGIGTLYLFDFDYLSVSNIYRHICGIKDIGRRKVDAISDEIEEHKYPTKTNKIYDDIIKEPDKFREIANIVDLVICATDNVKSRSMVNYICVTLKKPLILVCTYDNAKIGEIIKVLPQRSACLECVRIHQISQGSIIQNDESENPMPYSSQIEASHALSFGTKTDINMVSSLATKVTLSTIAGDNSFGNFPYDYITWGAVENSAFNNPFNFRLPFSVNYCNYEIHPKCPICGDMPAEIEGINIGEKYDEIFSELPK